MIDLTLSDDDEPAPLAARLAKPPPPKLLVSHKARAAAAFSSPQQPQQPQQPAYPQGDLLLDDCWPVEPLQRRPKRRRRTPHAAASSSSGSSGVEEQQPAPARQPAAPAVRQQPADGHNEEPPWQLQGELPELWGADLPDGGTPPGLWDALCGVAPAPAAAATAASGPQRRASGSRRAAARAAAAGSEDDSDWRPGPADTAADAAAANADTAAAAAAARGASGAGPRRPRALQTTEARAAAQAAKAADKAQKAADRAAAKLAKQAAAEAAKVSRKAAAFAKRKASGSFAEQELVLLMDAPTAARDLGLTVAAELQRRHTMAWQVVPQLPLSGRWQGAACFCFKRRLLGPGDEIALRTVASVQVQAAFREDKAPPYVQLLFEQPAPLLQELQRDRLAALCAAVSTAHPGCTLGLAVLGLKQHASKEASKQARKGQADAWDWRRVSEVLLELHLTRPGLQLRQLARLEDATAHVVATARAVAQQPYAPDAAAAAGGPGGVSKAAAAAIREDLGAAAGDFAVRTLGVMRGMGGPKASAVAKAYPSLGALMSAFQAEGARPGGQPELLLADLIEPAAAGKAKPRRLGPALSKRLHLLLTCEDPEAILEGEAEGEGEAHADTAE